MCQWHGFNCCPQCPYAFVRCRNLYFNRLVSFLKQTGDCGPKSRTLGRFICLKSLHRRLKPVIGTLKPLKSISLFDLMPIINLFVRILHRKPTGDGSLTWVFVPLLSLHLHLFCHHQSTFYPRQVDNLVSYGLQAICRTASSACSNRICENWPPR